MIICVSGTPGTGKSYLSKKLARQTGMEHIELNALMKKHKIYESYDRRSKSYVVDTKRMQGFAQQLVDEYGAEYDMKLYKALKGFVGKTLDLASFLKKTKIRSKGIIIDSHMSHEINADFCIITKCDLKKLKSRLKARGYGSRKIEENMQSEIFDICLDEALMNGQKVIIVKDQ